MCLYVDLAKTRRRQKGNPNDKIKIYKSFREPYYKDFALLKCLYRHNPFNGGLFKASGSVSRTNLPSEIHGGAIHCCTSKREIRRLGNIIVEGYALRKDLVAVGIYGDSCFTKVFLPKKNCLRAIREYKKKRGNS